MSDVALIYIGGGAWLPDVPARNLTAEEAERHAEAIEAANAAGHRLYRKAPTPKAGKAEKESND